MSSSPSDLKSLQSLRFLCSAVSRFTFRLTTEIKLPNLEEQEEGDPLVVQGVQVSVGPGVVALTWTPDLGQGVELADQAVQNEGGG